VRQARDDLRQQAKRARDELLGHDTARRVHEHAQRLVEEAHRAREDARSGESGSGESGAGESASGEHRDWEQAGARFSGAADDEHGQGWSGWPGRHGWDEWTRLSGRGWSSRLDVGTLRDLERLAVQFTSDLRKLAMQSGIVGENVIGDLRGILEEALTRIKTEIFDTPPAHPEDDAED
jgi:hypothetical protein